ncbi:ankyrin repeat domain-containing protein [Rickettsia prowazekii]|uniref:ankyrin repeat domain-containing protein n=1 Tax=Rickettsia prowazekii TaxID=782 RepID=UPI000256BF9F|nr:ankyrin repeat domain-containing protein [Rickettsia prowazekii]AFE50358.1 hypothetical protein M9Y_03475 [Rickettsia prowazekii str. Katsinyian]AFE51204.1 hypothetical protein MA1_03465 [Rickettsia prowazekii str. BuV67-CWPP]
MLDHGADPMATNDNGNNGIMYLFYRHNTGMDIRKHDFKALEILELLQRKNIPINAWIHQDRDKDTPLMEAIRAQLLECSKFIINLLKCHNHDLLQGQLSHQSNTGQDVFQLITSARFLDKMLNESNMIPTLIDIARFHIDDAIKINSPTAQEKDKLLSLIRESLSKLDIKEVGSLANMVFQEKLYNKSCGSDSTHHRKNLKYEYASGNFGTNIFNSIDVELIELLYVASGINLVNYKTFINSLVSLQDEHLDSIGMCGAVILESNKQKILQVINGSNTLSTIVQNISELNVNDEDIIATKDLALKRFCFLAANNHQLEINAKSEAGILLAFANIGENIRDYSINVHDHLKQLLMAECKTYEKLKKVLNVHGDQIAKIISHGNKLVSDLLVWDKIFGDDVDIVTHELQKLLNPNLGDVLPRNVFLGLIQNKKEIEITAEANKFIQDNLKFFDNSHKMQIPEYERIDQNQFKASTSHYQNNPECLIPNLTLLKMAHCTPVLNELRAFLNNHYIKAKSTVDRCLNVIISGKQYIKDLNISGLDSSADIQAFYNKIPILTDKITRVLSDSTIENVRNINLLCKQVGDFLNIVPITALFEEYSNNYQLLEQKNVNILNTLGELNSAIDFC